MTPQSVAVVGPGSVGCFFAAHLAATEHDVVACARRPFARYRVDSPEAPVEGPAAVVTAPADLPARSYDWVLVGVKAHQTEGAAPWLDRVCGPSTTVVAMQNGIEAAERLEPFVNGARVLAAVVYCGAELVEPGHITHAGPGRLIIPNDEAGHRLKALFGATPVDIDPSDSYDVSAWVKLSINVVANGITALTGQSMRVLGNPDLSPAAAALLREVLDVGRADGVELETDGVENTIQAIASVDGRTSMLQDTEAGRATEHDAIHGAVIRRARRLGMPVPRTELVHSLLAARSAALS